MNDSLFNHEVRRVTWSVAGLGFAAVVTQLALMREMLCAFCGNELILGVVLGNWLLITGAGAWLGRNAERLRMPFRRFVVAQVLVAVLPLLQILMLRFLRNVVFQPGVAIGVTGSLVSSFVLLLPFCIVSGYMLALACAVLSRLVGSSAVRRVYVADSLGSVAGGALFSFTLIRWFDHGALVCIPAALNLALASWVAWRSCARRLLFLPAGALAGLVALLALVNLDAISTAWQFPGQIVLSRVQSPYGKSVVTDLAGQLNFFENGLPMMSASDISQIEETVHYALSQRPGPSRVLLIGGGVSGTAREVLKYKGTEVTYVELDPALLEAGRKFIPENLDDERIKVVNTDGRRFVQHTQEKYDVIIVDLPPPSTSQLNRFFTAEFFLEARHALTPNGVLSFAMGRYENYISPELQRVLACTRRTLATMFREVLALPGGRVFFLASEGPLHLDVASRLDAAGIATRLVNHHYLDGMLTADRLADVRQACLGDASLNTDFSPVLYYYHLRYWMSQFETELKWLPPALLVLLALYLARLRVAALAVFASGFAASTLEMVMLLAIQILCGALYYQLGFVVTLFMTGLAAGALWIRPRRLETARVRLARLAFGIAALSGLLPPVLRLLNRMSSLGLVVQVSIGALAFLLAVLVGAEFPLAALFSGASQARAAAGLYLADFSGACLGALLASVWLLPVLGLTAVCLLAAALNLCSGVALLRTKT